MVDELRTLVTDLCRDDRLENVEKQCMLIGWREEVIAAGANRLLSPEQASDHFSSLEVLDNAIRIVS